MAKRIIFHIDVNSAYLSWEAAYRLKQGDKLDLREIPSAIGGDSAKRHGVILAKSVPAKKYNIKTGESLFSARRKCPNLVVVRPNRNLYMKYSLELLKLLEEYSPIIEKFSIDECFLDFTNMEKLQGEPFQAAARIKNRIKAELGFTVNIGISSNKLLAKMASELEKPDKIHSLFPEEIAAKMWPLPVSSLFMVGRVTAVKLENYGINTIGDLAKADLKFLEKNLKSHGRLIWNYAQGYDHAPVVRTELIPVKGIGNSTTTAFDIDNPAEAKRVLLSLSETVGSRLRENNYCASLIAIDFRTNDFLNYSHQLKISTPTDSTTYIYQTACNLFKELWRGQPLRFLGVRVSELCSDDFQQLAIFNEQLEKERVLDKTIDQIRQKYGFKAIHRSALLNPQEEQE